MSLVTEALVRDAAKRASVYKSAAVVLRESTQDSGKQFDLFLCHSIRDADLVLGAKRLLEEAGLSVYVDWLVDSDLERDQVTAETAARLSQRMSQSRGLIYLLSRNSVNSKWTPWELGYFDGHNGRVALMQITSILDAGTVIKGSEYLQLYPYVDRVAPQGGDTAVFWVNKSKNEYVQLKYWLDCDDLYRP